MVLKEGEQLHVMTRRLFEGDLRRHFVGRVTSVSGVTARLSAYAFVFDATRNHYDRRPELRERVIGLADAGLVINVMPSEVALDRLEYRLDDHRHLVVTDGSAFSLNINEFSAEHQGCRERRGT
jgi:hypothetical protein